MYILPGTIIKVWNETAFRLGAQISVRPFNAVTEVTITLHEETDDGAYRVPLRMAPSSP